MTLPEIAHYRLAGQKIGAHQFSSGSEIVSWLGAVQAQEYAHTKWSLALRLKDLKDDDLEKEFTEGKILRTHLMRPTWHFVTPEDIRWLLLLTAPRVKAFNAFMYRKMELDGNTFNRCNNIISHELEGGKFLTRTALNAAFQKNKIIADGLRLSLIMMQAELEGLICSGPREGNQFTYALLEERVRQSVIKTTEEALAELTKRYFTSRGPATAHDFSTWSGLTITDAKKGLAMVSSLFVREKILDKEYYFSSAALLNSIHPEAIYLLPVYDEFIMGYKNRDAILAFKNSLPYETKFFYDNTIIINGQISGTWNRTIHKKSINLSYQFFKPLKKQLKALEKAIKRLEVFTGLPVHKSDKAAPAEMRSGITLHSKPDAGTGQLHEED